MANKALLLTIAGLIGAISLGCFMALSPPAPNNLASELAASADKPDFVEADPATPPTIEGTWVLAARGGEDGQTACEDYKLEALYKLNGDMGEVAQYSPDGGYRATLAYTTPSGDEHVTNFSANWEATQDSLVLSNYVAQDAYRNESPREERSLTFDGANVVRIYDRRYVRCVGSVTLGNAI